MPGGGQGPSPPRCGQPTAGSRSGRRGLLPSSGLGARSGRGGAALGTGGGCKRDPGVQVCPPRRALCPSSVLQKQRRIGRGKKKKKIQGGFVLLRGFSATEFIKIASYGRRRGGISPRFRSAVPASGATQQTRVAPCWQELLEARLLSTSAGISPSRQHAKSWETTAHQGQS